MSWISQNFKNEKYVEALPLLQSFFLFCYPMPQFLTVPWSFQEIKTTSQFYLPGLCIFSLNFFIFTIHSNHTLTISLIITTLYHKSEFTPQRSVLTNQKLRLFAVRDKCRCWATTYIQHPGWMSSSMKNSLRMHAGTRRAQTNFSLHLVHHPFNVVVEF